MIKLFAAGVVAMMAMQATATTIIVDFSEFIHDGFFIDAGNPTISQGVEFLNSQSGTQRLIVWGATQSFNADPGGATLVNNGANSSTTVSLSGGGIFELTSIDLADVYNNGGGGNVQFTFNYADLSQFVTTVTVDNLPGLETFFFNQANLLSFTYLPLTTQGPWIQVDNVVINGGGTGVIPEPATWGLMIAGFGMVGATLRRRARAIC